MKKTKSKYLVLILTIMFILSINAVAAADNGTDDVLDASSQEILSVTPTGTFHNLQDKIADSISLGENLTLDSNDYYMHDSTDSENEITIDVPSQLLPFVINGNGATIDAGGHDGVGIFI